MAATLHSFIKDRLQNDDRVHEGYHESNSELIFLKSGDAILSTGAALYKCIKERLPINNLDPSAFVEFNWETVCYVLHLLDRSLSDMTTHSRRFRIVEGLLNAIESKDAINLREMGYDVNPDEVAESFRRMFNQRTLDYGRFRTDWFSLVATEFGRNAANALEVPESSFAELSLQISLLGPASYKDLLPHFDSIFKLALAGK